MPRGARIDIPGVLQHIIARGIERRKIFEDDREREYFLNQLKEVIIENEAKCYGWVIMPNHFHLVMVSGRNGIARFMRQLLTRYAVYYNRKRRRSGHLFQNRYKSIVCEEDPYLLELIRYVHLNPLKAGIIKTFEELSSYKWSGHRAVLGLDKREWQDRKTILNYFGKREQTAVDKYQEFLKDGIKMTQDFNGGGLIRSLGGYPKAIEGMRAGDSQVYDERILGSGEFVEAVLNKDKGDEEKREQLSKNKIGIKKLIDIMADKLNIDREELRGGRKQERLCKARGLISYIGQYYLMEKGVTIGKEMNKSGASISVLYNRGKELLKKDDESKSILRDILRF